MPPTDFPTFPAFKKVSFGCKLELSIPDTLMVSECVNVPFWLLKSTFGILICFQTSK